MFTYMNNIIFSLLYVFEKNKCNLICNLAVKHSILYLLISMSIQLLLVEVLSSKSFLHSSEEYLYTQWFGFLLWRIYPFITFSRDRTLNISVDSHSGLWSPDRIMWSNLQTCIRNACPSTSVSNIPTPFCLRFPQRLGWEASKIAFLIRLMSVNLVLSWCY